MKKLITILILAFSINATAQEVSSIDRFNSENWGISAGDILRLNNDKSDTIFHNIWEGHKLKGDSIKKAIIIDSIITIRKLAKVKYSNGTIKIIGTFIDNGNKFSVDIGGAYNGGEIFADDKIKKDNSEKGTSLFNGVLITKSGFKLKSTDKIKIGTGSGVDGDFIFIRRNAASLFSYISTNGDKRGANSANSLERSWSGLNFDIVRIEKRGNNKMGVRYYVIVKNPNIGLVKYEIDIDNAISKGEVEVPEEFKPKKKSDITIINNNSTSVADELTKLKKLLDDGILSKEEFDAQKKKLLEK